MRKIIIGIVATTCTAALFAAGLSLAASSLEIIVVKDGKLVAGAAVDVIASDGVVSGTTDANGVFAVDIAGKYFRVSVNGVQEVGGFSVYDSPVTIVIP